MQISTRKILLLLATVLHNVAVVANTVAAALISIQFELNLNNKMLKVCVFLLMASL